MGTRTVPLGRPCSQSLSRLLKRGTGGTLLRASILKSWRKFVVLVAAYMLVLQAVTGAVAMGVAASTPPLDIFGNPLCISGSAVHNSGGTDKHTAMPDCCTVACSIFSPATSDDRLARSLFNPLPASAHRTAATFEQCRLDLALERRPGSPRSPPAAVV